MYNRYWKVTITVSGFSSTVFVYGCENNMREYLESELGYCPTYVGATKEEVEMARKLHIKIYLA